MNKTRITLGMSIMDIITTMSEGNPGAMMVVMEMVKDKRLFMDILLLDSLDIRGSQLYMLHNDCCERNTQKFVRTLMMLRSGIFTIEEIKANLEQVRAISFIDEEIQIEGIPPSFGPTHAKWDEYCKQQKESFSKKIAPIIERQNGTGIGR